VNRERKDQYGSHGEDDGRGRGGLDGKETSTSTCTGHESVTYDHGDTRPSTPSPASSKHSSLLPSAHSTAKSSAGVIENEDESCYSYLVAENGNQQDGPNGYESECEGEVDDQSSFCGRPIDDQYDDQDKDESCSEPEAEIDEEEEALLWLLQQPEFGLRVILVSPDEMDRLVRARPASNSYIEQYLHRQHVHQQLEEQRPEGNHQREVESIRGEKDDVKVLSVPDVRELEMPEQGMEVS